MATNPMQKAKRNSFLGGMLITLIIAIAIVAFLVMQMMQTQKSLDELNEELVSITVINEDVNSGQILTSDMFGKATVYKSSLPSNATGLSADELINKYTLCDKEGNDIFTNEKGELYMRKGDQEVSIKKEESTGNLYTLSGTQKNYIETTNKALMAKVDMKANTIITSSMIVRTDEAITDDVRKQEYNMIVLPIDLQTDDYIDIRLMLPTGEDFIIISKKQVEIPEDDNGIISDTIWINLTEEELLTMSSAIVEAYQINGGKLYATKYAEAGTQEAAIPTYVVNSTVYALIEADPNIVSDAREALKRRYTSELTNMRNQTINRAVSQGDESAVQSGMEESITSTSSSRRSYLDSLSSTN